jgi:hypothetical protein
MMYVIIHKGRVVVGPLAWAQKYYTDVLKIRHRVQANIPGQAPEEMPYVIDEHTKIHEATEVKPPFDPMIEYHYGPLWDTTGDVVVANYEVRDLTVESMRNNFKALAAHERYKKEVSGTKLTIQDTEVSIATTRGERDNYVQKYMLMGEDETINWKFHEGWLTLTKEEMHAVVQASVGHVQAAFDWEKDINDQIDVAVSADELYAIEIEPKKEPLAPLE